MLPWIRYVIGILIAVHGYVYIPFAFYLVNEFQRTYGSPRLLRRIPGTAPKRTTTLALHLAAGVLLLACGVVVVIAPSAVPLWRALAVAGGAVGVMAFILAWNGRPTHLSEQGLLGAIASLSVLITGLAFAQGIA